MENPEDTQALIEQGERALTRALSHDMFLVSSFYCRGCLGALPTNTECQFQVARKNGYALGMDGAEVCVLKQGDQVCLASLLKSQDGDRLPAEVGLEVLADLAHQALKGNLTDKKLGGLLKFANFSQGPSTRAEAEAALHAARSGQACQWSFEPSTEPGLVTRFVLKRGMGGSPPPNEKAMFLLLRRSRIPGGFGQSYAWPSPSGAWTGGGSPPSLSFKRTG